MFTQVAAGWEPAVTWVNTVNTVNSRVPEDGQKHRTKHVELTWNNKLVYIVHRACYFCNCITMHGSMNVRPLGYLISCLSI